MMRVKNILILFQNYQLVKENDIYGKKRLRIVMWCSTTIQSLSVRE